MPSFEENLRFLKIAADAATYPEGRQEGTRRLPWDTSWFYRGLASKKGVQPEIEHKLNKLCRAYLGDEAARSELSFGTASESEIDANLLEGRFGLNERQRLAVRRALESDISLVQGPPGTGKTETILNMVSCMLGRGAAVAVVSNNGTALSNIAQKVAESEGVSEHEQPLRRRLVDSYASLGSLQKRDQWNEMHPEGPHFITRSTKEVSTFNKSLGCGGWEPLLSAKGFLTHRPFITSTIHSFKKCFCDGNTFQYDYIIMDEASQCPSTLALIAMSGAKHLVLVGDTEQLPPVYKPQSGETAAKNAKEEGVGVPESTSPYAMQDPVTGDGLSILASAQEVFGPLGAPRTFLNEHFRCHPGIIEFCSEEVYAPRGEALDVRTISYDRSVSTPVRIRWFEGDYLEPHRLKPKEKEGGTSPEDEAEEEQVKQEQRDSKGRTPQLQMSKENLKQLEIFMREEWPSLHARLKANEQLSVRVISPYRGMLMALYDRLLGEVGKDALDLLFPSDIKAKKTSDGEDISWLQTGLTIHRTQGQEYNVVYLLPAEDGDWDWPWSQGRSLVNVAVSRAKDELVLICSASLMSERTQRALTGTYIKPAGGASKGMTEEEIAQREERERFLQKLVDYVRYRTDPTSPSYKGEVGFPASEYAYGFHRTALDSAFDRVPLIRTYVESEDSSCELALCDALAEVDLAGRGLAVAHEVPLRSCFPPAALNSHLTADGDLGIEEKLDFVNRSDEKHASHFDLVIYERETRRLVLCIEVDGGQHRHVSPTDKKDSEGELAYRQRCYHIKDSIAQDMGARVLPNNDTLTVRKSAGAKEYTFTLLRLPTNGTTACETDRLASLRDEDGAIARSFTTIEQIIDMQLACNAEEHPSIDPAFDLDAHGMPSSVRTTKQIFPAANRAMSNDSVPSNMCIPARTETRQSQTPSSEYDLPSKDNTPQPMAQSPSSISVLLRRWREEGLFSDSIQAHEANRILVDAGIIKQCSGGYRATQKGADLGAVNCEMERDDGTIGSYCKYPISCKNILLPIILKELGANKK